MIKNSARKGVLKDEEKKRQWVEEDLPDICDVRDFRTDF